MIKKRGQGNILHKKIAAILITNNIQAVTRENVKTEIATPCVEKVVT